MVLLRYLTSKIRIKGHSKRTVEHVCSGCLFWWSCQCNLPFPFLLFPFLLFLFLEKKEKKKSRKERTKEKNKIKR